MKKTTLTLLAATLLVSSVTLHAENTPPAPAISQERMQQVYEEVKTPYKYGVVLRGEAGVVEKFVQRLVMLQANLS